MEERKIHVDGCKNRPKRGRWAFLSFIFQKAQGSSDEGRSSGPMVTSLSSPSSLSHYGLLLLSSHVLLTVLSTFHPALPLSLASTPAHAAELWMLCNKWVELCFVEYSAAHSDPLKKSHPWQVLPTNGQILKVLSVLNFFPKIWLELWYLNRKTTLPKLC